MQIKTVPDENMEDNELLYEAAITTPAVIVVTVVNISTVYCNCSQKA